MKIYTHPLSPASRRVVMTVAELGVPAELQVLDLENGAQHEAKYVHLNPNRLVPTLVDGDFVLWESNAIMQYVASGASDAPLWPQDRRARADISRWQCWQLAHCFPAVSILMWENLFKELRGQGAADPAQVRKGEESTQRVFSILDSHLRERRFLVNGELTLADISVATDLTYAEAARMPLAPYPHVRRWLDRIASRRSWSDTAPPL